MSHHHNHHTSKLYSLYFTILSQMSFHAQVMQAGYYSNLIPFQLLVIILFLISQLLTGVQPCSWNQKIENSSVFLFPFIANFDSDTGERAATSAHHSTNLIASSTINQRLVCKMHRQVVTLVLLKSVTLHDSVTCHTQRSLDMSQRRRGLM